MISLGIILVLPECCRRVRSWAEAWHIEDMRATSIATGVGGVQTCHGPHKPSLPELWNRQRTDP